MAELKPFLNDQTFLVMAPPEVEVEAMSAAVAQLWGLFVARFRRPEYPVIRYERVKRTPDAVLMEKYVVLDDGQRVGFIIVDCPQCFHVLTGTAAEVAAAVRKMLPEETVN